MAKEILDPVPVTIDNLETLESTTDSIRSSSTSIYNLLNGQDYKTKLKDIGNNVKLLSDIKKSLDSIVNTTSTSSVYTKSTTTSNISKPSDQQEVKSLLNQILQAVKDLRGQVSYSNTDQTNKSVQPPSTSPTQQENISKQQSESTRKSVNNAKEAIEKLLKEEQKEIKSQRSSYEHALASIEEGQQKQSLIMDSISRIGNNFLNLFTSNFRKIFDTWDRQIATLKETGMGAQNAVALNRMTKQTMEATEETLGWNVSIEKAIRATNSMLAAGQNPRYIRENNKQLITGLEGLGLNLQPSTVRAISQSVFESSHIKEIAEGYAKLMSPDTENAISKEDLSSFLNSDQYKQLRATMGMYGFSQADIQRELISQMEESVKGGATGKSAIDMAMIAAQARMTGGNVIVVPENVQDYIGIAQAGGTFTNVGNLSRDFAEAVRKSKTDPRIAQQFRQIAASTAMNNDFTVLENVIDNDAHTRHIATTTEIEQGQYEGAIPRMAKWIASYLPAESMGGLSQRLTGDAGFLTAQSFDLVGSIGKSAFATGTTFLLGKIAANTSPEGSLFKNLFGAGGSSAGGGGGALGKIGGLLGKTGPLALGLATVGTTAGLIYSTYEGHLQAEEQEKSDRGIAQEYYQQESSLLQQYNEAKLAGNERLAEDIRKQLNEARERTNQMLDKITTDIENKSDEAVKGGSTLGSALAGVGAGALIGGPIGALVGGLIGALGGYFISDVAVSNSGPDYELEREKRRAEIGMHQKFANGGLVTKPQLALVGEGSSPEMIIPLNNSERSRRLLSTTANLMGSSLNHYMDGGVVQEEQVAVVGEGNKPEVVIPLTNPDKAEELLSTASNLPSTNPEVSAMLSSATKKDINKTIADTIISFARAQIGKPYSIYSDGFVCNTLVHAALRSAGLATDWKLTNHNVARWWSNEPRLHKVPLSEAKPGMIGFSNKSSKTGYPQHMGIITENGKWVNASGSAVNGNYKRGEFVATPTSKGVVEASMNTKDSWGMVGAGYIDGMFDDSIGTTSNIPSPSVSTTPLAYTSSTPINFTPYIPPSDYSFFEDIEDVENSKSASPRIQDYLRYQQYLSNVSPEVSIVSPDLIKDILYSKGMSPSDEFYSRVSLNNPFGLKDDKGSLMEYTSLDAGVQSFISKVERMYDQLAQMSYRQQLDFMRDKHFITSSEHFHSTQLQADRLATSIDNLNMSVKESNRLASQSSRLPNMVAIPGRRYT